MGGVVLTQPTLSAVQSFQYFLSNGESPSQFAQDIALSPAQLVIVGQPNSNPTIDRSIADPFYQKLLIGFIPLTYTSASNSPDLFTNGVLPSFLGKPDVGWPGEYSVQYWTAAWQSVIFSAINNSIAHGFDGIFLDGLTGDLNWLANNVDGNPIVSNATQLLSQLLVSVHNYINAKNLDHPFYILGNTPINLGTNDLKNLDGIFNENLYQMSTGITSSKSPGSQTSNATSASYVNNIINNVIPIWEQSSAKVLGNDYSITTDPSSLLKAFIEYNDLGVTASVINPANFEASVISGPYFFSANNANSTVVGDLNHINYLAGDKTSSAKLVGGNAGDFFIGGWGNNTIIGGTGNDVIYAHPAAFTLKNILHFDYSAINNHGTTPQLTVWINGVEYGQTPIALNTSIDGTVNSSLNLNVSSFPVISSLKLVGSGMEYINLQAFSNIHISDISLNGQSINLSSGVWSNNINQPGLFNNNDTATFTGSSLSSANNPFPSNTSDQINGGIGLNTVIYWLASNQYSISTSQSGQVAITQNGDAQNSDILTNISRLSFSDTMVALDNGPTQTAGAVYMLYQATFNRTPDVAGLGYWINAVDKGANIITNVASFFVTSSEFVAKYGSNPTNASYVDNLYQNVLHRSGDAGGITYWNTQLNSGAVTKAYVLEQFATLAEGAANVAPTIANGIQYQQWVG